MARKSTVDILRVVKAHVQNGTYLMVKHAVERQQGRRINLPDILYVLRNGRHEEEKDIFDIRRQTWKHAIRGKTINGVDLRVVVALEKEMVIITLIKLE